MQDFQCWMCSLFEAEPRLGGRGRCDHLEGLMAHYRDLGFPEAYALVSGSAKACPVIDLTDEARAEIEAQEAEATAYWRDPARHNGVRPGVDFPASLNPAA